MSNQPNNNEVFMAGHCAFWIPLPAVRSKSNYRHMDKGNAWRKLQGFENEVALSARAVLPSAWVLGDKAASVSERPSVVCCIAAKSLLDAGNLSKSVLDAVQGVIYYSDASVKAVTEIVERTSTDQCGAAGFVLLKPDATEDEVIDALTALPRALLTAWRSSQNLS